MAGLDVVYFRLAGVAPRLVVVRRAPGGHEGRVVVIRLAGVLLHRSAQHAQQVNAELRSDPLVAALPSHPVQENIFPRLGHVPHNVIGESQVLGGEVQLSPQVGISRLYPRVLDLLQVTRD